MVNIDIMTTLILCWAIVTVIKTSLMKECHTVDGDCYSYGRFHSDGHCYCDGHSHNNIHFHCNINEHSDGH